MTDLAARLLDAPAAHLSLVEGATALAGLATPLTADDLCVATADATGPLVVPDAAADSRVATVAAVVEGAVGAYLGVPLLGREGRVLGALCVTHPAPRDWSGTEVALLTDLAAAAVTELELAALSADYEADRVRWQLAVGAGGVGSFDWDLVTGRIDWDDQLHLLFGMEPGQFGGTIEEFNAVLHPDDVPRVAQAIDRAVATCSEYDAEYRVLLPGGSTRWVQARGTVLAGEDGTAVRLLGAAYDTTAKRDAEGRIARVLETMSAAFFLLDDAWRFTYVNAEAERLLGRTREQLVGGDIWELYPAAVGSDFEVNYRGAVQSGQPRAFEAYYPPPLDAWYEVRAWPGQDGLSVYFLDITTRRTSQQEAGRAQERLRAASARLHLLAAVSDDLSSTLDTEDAVRRLARHLVPGLATWCLITMADEHRHLRDIASWHAEPGLRRTVEHYADLRLTALSPRSYLFQALRTGQLVAVPDATETIAAALSGEAREVLRGLAPHMAYAIPMRARGRTVGAITLFLDAERGTLPPEDLTMLVQLADRAGLALDNARLYEEQRHISETLQRALLSAPVEPDHVHVVVRYLPADQAAEVGGDWYDAFLQRDGATVLAIGDVMGHDTQAAAAMSQVRTLLRGIAYTSGGSPAEVLESLDDAMRALKVDTMATAVVARLEQTDEQRARGQRRLRWSNAGHLAPLLVRPDATVHPLHGAGPEMLLGVAPGRRRTDSDVVLDSGSTVLMFTDGLVERRGEHVRDGLDRLHAVLTELAPDAVAAARSPDGLDLEALVDEVVRRMLDGRADDDVAVVAVHLYPQDAPRPPEAGPAHL
ncbi:GAF domain-containing protein [Cellulomonas shaoxiangyii]|uniref:GAF domain-containing protein n=1 Tax=Cellulomonas shaoxiangyii TaxID=2566013 RepID=A0A4P7SLK5_9CELL|nr:GAF domain-containing protein [Cellulomonas shaoxiangyii]TGY83010.1 GAF domain-containing protein [Cellulomonas shaoxiangyii]